DAHTVRARSPVKPEVHLLGISIKTFGVTFALGFLACGFVIARRLRELEKPVDWSYEIVFAALLGGLIGARAYFVIQNYSQVKHDLIGSIFSGPGLVRRGDRRSHRRDRLDALAPHAESRDFRHVRDGACLGLWHRPDRLPGLRRRRLRDRLQTALGDGLSARNRAHAAGSRRSAHTDLRDGLDVPARLLPVEAARPGAPGSGARALSLLQWPRAPAGGVHPSQQRGLRRSDLSAVGEHRLDGDRSGALGCDGSPGWIGLAGRWCFDIGAPHARTRVHRVK